MTIAYDVAGDGPAVVLLHATVCDRQMWDPQWPVLAAAGYRVVRCDFRGFGETPIPGRPYSDADDVLELMDTLGLGQAALIGASYGGKTSVEIAARWPDRVTALALICPGWPGREPGPELRAFGEREDALLEAGDIAAAVDLNVATWLGPEASAEARQQVLEMQRHAFDLQLGVADEVEMIEADIDLAAVRARCLVLSGGRDLPDFRQIAAAVPGLLPGARHVELPWAGHLPSLERPAEVTPLLVDFLAETVPAAAR